MNEFIRIVAALAVICLCSGLAVSVAHQQTAGRITDAHARLERDALARVVPAGSVAVPSGAPDAIARRYWRLMARGEVNGYAFPLSARGYAGEIRAIAAIDTAGTVLGVTVLRHNESPGLGARITETAESRYLWQVFQRSSQADRTPWFLEQFVGLDLDQRIGVETHPVDWYALGPSERARLRQSNAVSAVTGATVSSRALVRGLETTVYPALRRLREEK